MITKLENGNARIEEYSFAEFLKYFEQAVLDGYRLDLESNDNFPQKYGSHLTVTLVEATEVALAVPDEADAIVAEVVADVVPVEVANVVPVVEQAASPVRRRRSTN